MPIPSPDPESHHSFASILSSATQCLMPKFSDRLREWSMLGLHDQVLVMGRPVGVASVRSC